LSRTLNLSNYAQPALSFKTCYNMRSANDRGYLEVSTDGIRWTRVSTYTNSTLNWTTMLVDLSRWGKASNLRLRFNAKSQTGLLWHVDDVRLDGWPAIASAAFTYSPQPVPIDVGATFSASYTSINTTLPVTYTWDFGDGSAPVVAKKPTTIHRFLSNGSHTVQLVVENPYDRQVASQSVVVYRPLGSTFFSFAPTLPAEKAPVNFTASYLPANATQPVTYTWNFGDSSAPVVSTNAKTSHTFTTTGYYTVILTTTNGYGPPTAYSSAMLVWRHRIFLVSVSK